MNKILITGGAGFIGTNLTEYFLNKGYKVTCLDNFATGHRYNIESFLNNPNYQLIEGDIRDLETCKNIVRARYYCPTTLGPGERYPQCCERRKFLRYR